MSTKIRRFTNSLVDYLETGENFKKFTKRQAIQEAIKVLTNDEGAFNQFIAAVKRDKAFCYKEEI